jgi:hypothetical protein
MKLSAPPQLMKRGFLRMICSRAALLRARRLRRIKRKSVRLTKKLWAAQTNRQKLSRKVIWLWRVLSLHLRVMEKAPRLKIPWRLMPGGLGVRFQEARLTMMAFPGVLGKWTLLAMRMATGLHPREMAS